jgi:hypothetical protein
MIQPVIQWLPRAPRLSARRSWAFDAVQRWIGVVLIVIAGLQLQAPATLAQTAPVQTASAGQAYVKQAEPYLDFIRDHLWQQVGSGPLQGVRALAETEKPLNGDVWFWTDDNAKALEAFLVPEAYARYQDIADSLLSFVRRMSEGPVILRRIAKPMLNVQSENPENFRVSTGLMTFHGDLRRDEVAVSYRFHDGRDVDAVKLTGNWIRFDLGGRTYQFDVKDSIVSARLARQDGLVILQHVSEFVDSGLGPVARATYSYTIDPALTRLLLDISVEALNGATLSNVQVTSAMDHLSDLSPQVSYQRFCGMRGEDLSCRDAPAEARIPLAKDGLDWYSLIQLGNLGFSYAVHTQIMAPARLTEVTAEGSRNNRFNRVYSVYGMGDVDKTAPGRIREAKLLTSGGLYQSMAAYGDLIRNSGNSPGIDFSASYDYGAELNAVGCYYMFASSGRYDPARRRDDPEVVGLKDWFDRHLSMFAQNFLSEQNDKENPFPYLFGRGTAFAILATDCMYRATGEDRYLASMKRMVDVVLRLQRWEGGREFNGIFRCCGTSSDLDSQAAMILSLARAALLFDDPRLGPAIVDGINAIRMNRWQAVEGRPIVARGDDQIFIPVDPNNPRGRDGILWGFKAGVLLRGLAAAEFAADSGRIAIDHHTRWYIERLRAAATDYIDTSTIPRGRSLEILTSYRSGETNSESQPWMVLGLFPIDPIVAQVRPPGQAEATIPPSPVRVDAHPAVDVRFATGGQTTENELVLSTAPTELGRSVYRLDLNFGANVCPDHGISSIVLNILYHRETSIVKIEAVEPSSQANCENGSLQFEFRNRDIGLSELNVYARRVLSLPQAPVIKHLERMD